MGGAECDFEVHTFESVCDVRSFLTDICEASPILCGVDRYLFVSVGGWGLGVCAVLLGRSCYVGCYVLCWVLVGILIGLGCRSWVCCTGI